MKNIYNKSVCWDRIGGCIAKYTRNMPLEIYCEQIKETKRYSKERKCSNVSSKDRRDYRRERNTELKE